MGIGYAFDVVPGRIIARAATFAFGLVAFGFLGMARHDRVDSYGPVTDNAQSVYELSVIEKHPNVKAEVKRDFGSTSTSTRQKHFSRRTTAPATRSRRPPSLSHRHGVVGATTMIFSIIHAPHGRPENRPRQALVLHSRSFGLVDGRRDHLLVHGRLDAGVSTGATARRVHQEEHQKLDASVEKASVEDSKAVVAICTKYAQKGMFNIFLTVFFSTPPSPASSRSSSSATSSRSRSSASTRRSSWRTRAAPGQREEARRGRPQGEGHRAARGDRRRDTVGDPFKDNVVGGHEPHHQVHDHSSVSSRGARRRPFALDERDPGGRVLPDFRSFSSTAPSTGNADRELARRVLTPPLRPRIEGRLRAALFLPAG